MGQSADELRKDIEQTREGLSDTLDAIGDRVSPGRVLERRKNRIVNGVQSVRDRVMGSVTDAKDKVADGTGGVVDSVKDTPGMVRQQTQGSPIVAGAVAFGVGFLVAAIFPPSQAEQQAAEGLLEKAEPLKEEVSAAAQEVAGSLKEATKDAVGAVTSAASDSSTAVADTVRDNVEATTSTAKDSVADVQQKASS